MSSFRWRRAHTVIASVIGLALVGGGVALAADPGPASPSATPAVTPSPTPSAVRPSATPKATVALPPSPAKPRPRPAVDPLTGQKPSSHEVFAVKIENIAAARPQLGLGAADIVFVEEVEARLTRLIAVYHSEFPRRVGPVRSARSTDAELLPLFGRPGLVYSGANRRVQRKLDRAPIVDLQRSTRDHSRVAPHNVVVNLRRIAGSTKVGRAEPIGWTFAAADPRWAAAAKDASVKASVGGDAFAFAFKKDRYVVRWKGRTYADGRSVVEADNVLVLSVHNHGDGNADVNGSASVKSDTVGAGQLLVYRQGRVRTGTWKRTTAEGPLRLLDRDGRDISLTPGRTWVLLRG